MTVRGETPGLRVTFLSWRDLSHPQAGGSEVLIDRLATGCVDRGHQVTLMCGGPVGERAYRVLDLGGRFSQYLRAPAVFWRRVRDTDVIVDVENGIPFFSPLWSRTPRICLVHHVHGEQWRMHFAPGVAAVGWALERWGMPTAYRHDPFIAMSPSTAASLREIGISRSAINVLTNGVDIPPQTPGAVSTGEPLFLALGRLVPHKRIDLLLRTWEKVRPCTGGRLLVAGDGPEIERLRELAGEGVEILGAVSEERKAALLRSAWLLVHPAHHEGWGIVVMEAAAHGTPTLAFDVPGVRDAVQDGVTGVLVDDEAGLQRRWIELAANGERRRELGLAALRRARDFGWEATLERFEELLREASCRRSPTEMP